MMHPAQVVEFDSYIAPDGQEYHFHDARERFLMTISGQGMPEINYRTVRGPFQHGVTVRDFILEPRVVQVLHRRNACDRDDYWAKRADILDLLRPNRQPTLADFVPGTLRKRLPDRSIRDLRVLIAQGPEFAARSLDAWDEWAYTEALRFIAHDPVFFDPTQNEEAVAAAEASDQLVFPFEFPFVFDLAGASVTDSITYLGTWLSYPSIEVDGPIAGPVIQNVTTGRRLELLYSIPAGRTVTFDLDYGEKSVEDDLGTNLIGVLTTQSDLADFALEPDPLAPGGVNELSVQGTGLTAQTACRFRWLNRYIGI